MHRAVSVRGCEQAVIPFAAAPPPARSDATPADAAALYLALRRGDRVRVLRRECCRGADAPAPAHSLRSVQDGTALSAPQWCIAQREDGAVGLVPGCVLHRVAGTHFTLRHCGQSGAVAHHRDPQQGSSGHGARSVGVREFMARAEQQQQQQQPCRTADAAATQPPAARDGAQAAVGAQSCDSEDDDVAADALQLQQRRRASLPERLAALEQAASPTPAAALSAAGCVPDAPGGPGDAADAHERCERQRLAGEHAVVRAELRWLTDAVVPRLAAACAADRATPPFAGCDAQAGAAAMCDLPAALEGETRQLAELLAEVEALWAGLDLYGDGGAAAAPLRVRDPNASEPAQSPAAKLPKGAGTASTRSAPAPRDSYAVEWLRQLVREDMDTSRSYTAQKCAIEQRRATLAALMREVAAEEVSLADSEAALHALLDTGTAAGAPAWPRALPGLTAEEGAALAASLRVHDKYALKRQAVADAHSSTETRTLASAVAPPSAGPATPDRRPPGCASATPARVEHLRRVMEGGDLEMAQLEAKTAAARELCDTFGPAAREITEQLRRGERILAEKRRRLAQLEERRHSEQST